MAVVGGLGATGSAVGQILTGSILFPLLRAHVFDGDGDLAWRYALTVPAVFALLIALFVYVASDDCPLGNYHEVKRAGLMLERSAADSFRRGVYNINSWILALQYAGSSGVDLTMSNGAVLFYHYRFHQTIAMSSFIAFVYGMGALYARAVGGYGSDWIASKFSFRGRLCAQFVCMLLQGASNIWFARTSNLGASVVLLVVFSVLVQMSMGTCFGLVPYIDGPNTGAVAGIAGAGGNVGAALLGCLFMLTPSPHGSSTKLSHFQGGNSTHTSKRSAVRRNATLALDRVVATPHSPVSATHQGQHVTVVAKSYIVAMERMGWFTIFASLLTPLIVVKGYKGLFGRGHEEQMPEDDVYTPDLTPRRRQEYKEKRTADKTRRSSRGQSPLLVPGKLQTSPHLVVIKKRKQRSKETQQRLPPKIRSSLSLIPPRSSSHEIEDECTPLTGVVGATST
jgi:hypothetical protein